MKEVNSEHVDSVHQESESLFTKLLAFSGSDATEAFEDIGHSDDARDIMKKYLIGSLDEAGSGFAERSNSCKH